MNTFKKGFTLIEVLTTIAIVAFMLIIGIPSFQRYGYSNNLSSGANLLESAIYEAKNYSIAPRVTKGSLINYYVLVLTNDKIYLYETEEHEESSVYTDEYPVKTYEFPKGVFLDSEDVNIVFSLVENGKIIFPDEDMIIIRLKHDKLSDGLKEVKINTEKLIVNIE